LEVRRHFYRILLDEEELVVKPHKDASPTRAGYENVVLGRGATWRADRAWTLADGTMDQERQVDIAARSLPDLETIRKFVVVAEELHFGRAADRLGITQPPLSRAIGRLERRLGVPLLVRTSRSVALTPAGAVLLDEARGLLTGLDTAVRRTLRAARDCPTLVIAAKPGSGTGLLRDIVTAYRRQEPQVEVDFTFTHDAAAAVRGARADVALLCMTEDVAGLRSQIVGWELPVALVPASHPFAGRATVRLTDLERDPTYRARCPETSFDEIIDLVALRRLIVMVGEGAADRLGSGVVAVPVSDCDGTVVTLAWKDDAQPLVIGLVATARALAASRAAAAAPERALA
jgi:DNA-binding transcriptional LysR family regulator